MKSNLAQHPCANKCTNFKDEQCNTCLIQGQLTDFLSGDVVVYMNHIEICDLKTVEAFQPTEYYWLEGGQLVHRTDIRTASAAERTANKRLENMA